MEKSTDELIACFKQRSTNQWYCKTYFKTLTEISNYKTQNGISSEQYDTKVILAKHWIPNYPYVYYNLLPQISLSSKINKTNYPNSTIDRMNPLENMSSN